MATVGGALALAFVLYLLIVTIKGVRESMDEPVRLDPEETEKFAL